MTLKTSETTEGQLGATSTHAAARGDTPPKDDARPSHAPHIRIRSEESGVQLNLGDLWAYRELLYFLTWRDVKVRYKQTLMGIAWVIVQPLLTMLIFTLVFNRFARLDTAPVPYPLFAYSGLLVWAFFSTAVASGTNSLISDSNLITKAYFPRVFIPAAAVIAGLVDMLVGSLLLVALAARYGVHVTWGLLLLPVFVLLATMLALGVGMLVSALTVKYRDLRHVVPFVMQTWMFASPVIYPTGIVPERWRWVFAANPMTGVIEGFRAAVAGQGFNWMHVSISTVVAVALVGLAFYVFRRLEDTFADVI